MADENNENCFPLLDDDDDELGFDELFGGNSFDELLTDAADSMCETIKSENYDNRKATRKQI